MEKLFFAIGHYALFTVSIGAAYGLGRLLTGWMPARLVRSPWLTFSLSVTAGLGLAMVVLFLAGLLGFLNEWVIAVLGLSGLGLAGFAAVKHCSAQRAPATKTVTAKPGAANRWWWAGIGMTGALYLLLKPLAPPDNWDDVMYHLPYAKLWAEQGALIVNEWLRFPLFPYNMNLLYAASLVFDNDNLPQILHGSCAALTAALTFAIAQRYLDWKIGLIAAIELIVATGWGWGNAFIDLGLMLFWTAAFSALVLRRETSDHRFSYLAAFLAGIAVGIKYQALFFLPAFVALALATERRTAVVVKSASIFMVIGGYWYLRNYIVSGDPVHPVGGPLFGHWLWNADDLATQYADLETRVGWPNWYLCLSVGAVIFWRGSSSLIKGAIIGAVVSTAIWAWASGYPRYLASVYPILALLSAYFLARSGAIAWVETWYHSRTARVRQWIPIALFGVAVIATFSKISEYWGRIAPDEQSRETYLSERYPGYRLLRAADFPDTETLYQLGFENEIYYLGRFVRGEVFGPGRYADARRVADDSAALANHLNQLGASALLVNTARPAVGFSDWPSDPDWRDHFELVAQSDGAALYRLKPDGDG